MFFIPNYNNNNFAFSDMDFLSIIGAFGGMPTIFVSDFSSQFGNLGQSVPPFGFPQRPSDFGNTIDAYDSFGNSVFVSSMVGVGPVLFPFRGGWGV